MSVQKTILLSILALSLLGLARGESRTGVLLLAHGGASAWNDEVNALALKTNATLPTEVAFGMAARQSIQDAVDRLVKRGVREIVAVPLFVSSHSSVVTSTQYLLGVRPDAPKELAIYAKMSHGHGGHAEGGHAEHAASTDGTKPIQSNVPIRMAPALDAHPLVAGILLSRALAISADPKQETVVLVAHGPVSDSENAQWLRDMGSLAGLMRAKSSFHKIEYLTVRDDAPEPIRGQAAAELRALVERSTGQGDKVLLVPLLISYGGIEAGIRKRLEGLKYTMSPQALLPDDRLVEWVLDSARRTTAARDALLVIAHGSNRGTWNERVSKMVERVDWDGPKGVAFLTTANPEETLPTVVARLDREAPGRIIGVPLLVSSVGDHYDELRYYFGELRDAPGHAHEAPLQTRAKLLLTKAMDDHPLLARILADEVRSISTRTADESVVLVAHGPNEDGDNRRTIAYLESLARQVRESAGVRRAEAITLRDDADKTVRDAATESLREMVKRGASDGRVLIVPVLISVGPIQREIEERLQGLEHTSYPRGISESALCIEWVKRQALEAAAGSEVAATR